MGKKPIKRKNIKWFIVLIVVTVISLSRMYLNSPYTFMEERKIINYALQGSRGDFRLHRVYLNTDDKTIKYVLVQKYKGDVSRIFMIRNRLNKYLDINIDYFLNDDYKITIDLVGNRSGVPGILLLTNMYKTYYLGELNIVKFESLDCLIIYEEPQHTTLLIK